MMSVAVIDGMGFCCLVGRNLMVFYTCRMV